MKVDIILLDLRQPHFTPLLKGKDSNLKAHIVYAAHGEEVETTIIDGQIVVRDKVIQMVDEQEVIERANAAFLSVFERISPGQ